MGKFFLRLENLSFLIHETAGFIQGHNFRITDQEFTVALLFLQFQFNMGIALHRLHRFYFGPVQAQFKGTVAHNGQKLGQSILREAELLLVKEIGMITHIVITIGRTCRKHPLFRAVIFLEQCIDLCRLFIAPMHLRKIHLVLRAELPVLTLFHGLHKGCRIFHHIEFIQPETELQPPLVGAIVFIHKETGNKMGVLRLSHGYPCLICLRCFPEKRKHPLAGQALPFLLLLFLLLQHIAARGHAQFGKFSGQTAGQVHLLLILNGQKRRHHMFTGTKILLGCGAVTVVFLHIVSPPVELYIDFVILRTINIGLPFRFGLIQSRQIVHDSFTVIIKPPFIHRITGQ